VAYNEVLARRMRAHLGDQRGLVEKKMFGGIGFMLNGNMACGVHGQNLIVRLSNAAFERALRKPGVAVFDMTGRPMKGWITVSDKGYASDKDLEAWIDQGLTFANFLPHK
jgi:hypothetical protein